MSRPVAVVTGGIATFGVGGVARDYGQYVGGFHRLGLDTYYLEDSGLESYDPRLRRYGSDYSYGVEFIATELTALSPRLAKRSHLRTQDEHTYGLAPGAFRDIVVGADVFLNVSASELLDHIGID